MANLNNYHQLQRAYTKAFENAIDLLTDSKILFENKRYPRSYLLAHICIEELAICIMIASGMSKFKLRSLDARKLINRQKSHTSKIELAYSFIQNLDNYKLPLTEKDRLEIIIKMFSNDIISENRVKELDSLKNASLYSDFYEGIIKKPTERISEVDAKTLLVKASILLSFIESNNWHVDDNLITLTKKLDADKLKKIKDAVFPNDNKF